MRPGWFTLLVVLAAAGCGTPSPGPPPSTTSLPFAGPIHITPSNIRRLRDSFPAGYEISDTHGTVSPATFWGLRPGWSSDPSQCSALADPAAGGSSPPEGLSGSGSGGIISTVVAAAPSATGPDPNTVSECSHWSMDSGRTTAIVDRFDGPEIDGVQTLGMVTAIRTTVEGGNEIDTRATNTVAYLGDYVAFVTVVTDPGSGPSQLPTDLASTLLIKAVATLRG